MIKNKYLLKTKPYVYSFFVISFLLFIDTYFRFLFNARENQLEVFTIFFLPFLESDYVRNPYIFAFGPSSPLINLVITFLLYQYFFLEKFEILKVVKFSVFFKIVSYIALNIYWKYFYLDGLFGWWLDLSSFSDFYFYLDKAGFSYVVDRFGGYLLEILLIINTLIIINLLYQNNSDIKSDEIKDLKIDKKKIFNKEEEMEDYDSEFYRNGALVLGWCTFLGTWYLISTSFYEAGFRGFVSGAALGFITFFIYNWFSRVLFGLEQNTYYLKKVAKHLDDLSKKDN